MHLPFHRALTSGQAIRIVASEVSCGLVVAFFGRTFVQAPYSNAMRNIESNPKRGSRPPAQTKRFSKYLCVGKGVRYEWHCRLVWKDLRQAAVINSSFACSRGLVNKASSLGLRLLALGSTRSGRWPTISLALVC
jgi:hypothetical protein